MKIRFHQGNYGFEAGKCIGKTSESKEPENLLDASEEEKTKAATNISSAEISIDKPIEPEALSDSASGFPRKQSKKMYRQKFRLSAIRSKR